MQVIKLNSELRLEWDELAINSPDCWLFHLYDWICLLEEVWGFKSLSFLIKSEQGETLGICPLFIEQGNKRSVFRSKVLLSGKGATGPAVANGIGEEERREILNEMFSYIDSLAGQIKADRLIIELSPCSPSYLAASKTGINPLLPYRFRDISTAAYILDLRKSLDDLWLHSSYAFRKNVKKALSFDIKITQAERFSDIEQYYRLHLATYNRTGARPHPFEYFKLIWERFASKGMAKIFFAEYRGEKIAALNVAIFKNVVYYWTTCSNSDYWQLRPGNLISWEVTKWAKERGYFWINIGEVYPGSGNQKLLGIYRFKKSMGAELSIFYKGVKIYRPLRVRFYNLSHRLRDIFKLGLK